MPRTPARRFLAHGAGSGHGYRTQPLRELPEVADDPDVVNRIAEATDLADEPEVVGPAIVNAYTDLARTYDKMRHDAEVQARRQARQCLTMERRMAEAQRQAKLRHIDVSGELHVIAKMTERARRGGRTDPPAALQRMEKVEAALDYRPDLAA